MSRITLFTLKLMLGLPSTLRMNACAIDTQHAISGATITKAMLNTQILESSAHGTAYASAVSKIVTTAQMKSARTQHVSACLEADAADRSGWGARTHRQ